MAEKSRVCPCSFTSPDTIPDTATHVTRLGSRVQGVLVSHGASSGLTPNGGSTLNGVRDIPGGLPAMTSNAQNMNRTRDCWPVVTVRRPGSDMALDTPRRRSEPCHWDQRPRAVKAGVTLLAAVDQDRSPSPCSPTGPSLTADDP